MKNRILVLIFTTFFTGNFCTAEYVTKDQAQRVAELFIIKNQVSEKAPLNEFILTPVEDLDLDHYVFDINQIGFIIISSDDKMPPVLAYSLESTYPADGSNLNFNSYKSTFNEQLEYCKLNNYNSPSEFKDLWNSLIPTDKSYADDTLITVGPLMHILWNQDYPYNAYCPKDSEGPGERVYAGCVATAYCMAMYYYRYPEVGENQHSYSPSGYGEQSADYKNTHYRWNEMKNKIDASDGNSIAAVAELQYHAGVGVNMGYSPSGSGASTFEAKESMRHYFRYDNGMQYLNKSNYLPEQWVPILRDELDAKRPMVYSGSGEAGGHAFICDGYKETTGDVMFHFNFGWGGAANGYYTYLAPQGFGAGQGIIRHIKPEGNYPYYCSDQILNGASGSFTDGSGPIEKYKPDANCSWLIKPADSISDITFKFIDINLAANDTLYVYSGIDRSGELVGKYSGTEIPANFSVNNIAAFFNLKSDGTNESEGFEIEYSSTIIPFCSSEVFTNNSDILTDGSTTSRYNNDVTCQWIIKPENSVNLGLKFTEINLGKEDRLNIYESEGNENLIGYLTGDSIPPVLMSSTGIFKIELVSNSFDNGYGFTAYYSAAYGIDEKTASPNFTISPNPASEFINICFTIPHEQPTRYEILNLQGGLIQQGILENPVSGRTIVNLHSIQSGCYIFRIVNNEISLSKPIMILN
jgi:hypothetical protein